LKLFFKNQLVTTPKPSIKEKNRTEQNRTEKKMATTNEIKLLELKQENEELRELLEIQEGKLERAMFAIYQLHGGLYNQISQRYILAKKNALLYGQPLLADANEAESEDFTTRQGDNHEIRLRQMEETIEMLEGKIESFETKTNKLYIKKFE
jgi:hypothetical protein